MDAVEYYFRTASLWIVLGLPIVFAVLAFVVSASYFRFIAAAMFALASWWLLTEPPVMWIRLSQGIGMMYIILAIMMPFVRIGKNKIEEDVMDTADPESSLDRYAARLDKQQAKYRKMRGMGRRKIIRANPYGEEGEE